MDKERILDMVSMRIDGASFQEIGDKYGISKQAAYMYLISNLRLRERKSKSINDIDKVCYPGLKKWMFEHHVTQRSLAKRCGMHEAYISAIMRGQRKPGFEIIEKILKETGLSYEEAFRKEQ